MCVTDLAFPYVTCLSIFHCQALSLFALALPSSFLCFNVPSSLQSPLLPRPVCLPFSLPVVSYGFQTLPLSSFHRLHFDVCPRTATPTTANTELLWSACLSLLSLHLVIINMLLKGCLRDYCFFPNLAQMSTKTQRIFNLFVFFSYSFANYDCEIVMFWKSTFWSYSVPITQREKEDFDIK